MFLITIKGRKFLYKNESDAVEQLLFWFREYFDWIYSNRLKIIDLGQENEFNAWDTRHFLIDNITIGKSTVWAGDRMSNITTEHRENLKYFVARLKNIKDIVDNSYSTLESFLAALDLTIPKNNWSNIEWIFLQQFEIEPNEIFLEQNVLDTFRELDNRARARQGSAITDP